MSLISEAHRQRYRDYYATHVARLRPSPWVEHVEIIALQVGARDILDYGCGDARSLSRFYTRLPVFDYDPGVVGLDRSPEPADLVVSLHMLEHVEPESVNAVIQHMQSLTLKALLIAVSCEPSTKVLADGTQWHTFVRSAGWWRERLSGFEERPPRHDRPGAEFVTVWRTE